MSFDKSYRRRGSLFPKPIAKGLMLPMTAVLKKRGFDHEAILHYWAVAAGDELALQSQPIRLSGKAGGYTQLVVRVKPAFVAIFTHESEAILERLTRYIGYRPANRIVVLQE
jgi:hypothetical protein